MIELGFLLESASDRALATRHREQQPIARLTARTASSPVQCRHDASRNLVVFSVRGRSTLRDLTAAVTRSLDFGLTERVLWDLEAGELGALSLAELEAFVDEVFSGPWAPRHCAIVGGVGPALAAAAVLCALAESRGFPARVEAFVTRDDALAWLGLSEEPNDSPPPASSTFTR